MIEQLIDIIKQYQVTKGNEFDPQIILLKLSGCKVCKSLETDLMLDGWAYEAFDFIKSEHEEIADEVENTLQTNSYPIIVVTYPTSKIIVMSSPVRHDKVITNLNPNQTIYEQLIHHLS